MKKLTLQILSLILAVVMIGCAEATIPTVVTDDSQTEDVTATDTTEQIPDETGDVDLDEDETTGGNTSPDWDDEDDPEKLDEKQRNSIAMLNYLAVLTQKINDSKNSRMFLEEAYSSLINNTSPDTVNDLAESHLASLLDIIENYRIVNVKRERLELIYKQNQARAIRDAIPNPIGLLSAVSSFDLGKIAASILYMGVDSYNSYMSSKEESNQEYLMDGWELDDEEAANLHESRKRAFLFMIETVNEYNIPGSLALSEEDVENFVFWSNYENAIQRVQYLEKESEKYKAFGNYWLVLADSYYELGEYQKCLDVISSYEENSMPIFRKDYDFARVLPKVIAAAEKVYAEEQYIKEADRFCNIILDNTNQSDWPLRYFVAQSYISFFSKTESKDYLQKAYDIAKANVNILSTEQRKLNDEYVADLVELSIPDDATREEKKQIKAYNKALEEKRKTELPPIYEPLFLNCELLFALADKIDVPEKEKADIDSILHPNGSSLFLTYPVDSRFTFSSKEADLNVQYDKDELMIPASLVSENSVIKVTVTDGETVNEYTDWTVNEVERESEEFSSFIVTYESDAAGNQEWSENSSVLVCIYEEQDTEVAPFVLNFKVTEYSHHYVIPDSVTFELVQD